MTARTITEATLIAYHLGDLDAATHAEVEARLAEAPELRAELAAIQAFHGRLRRGLAASLPEQMPPERVWSALKTGLPRPATAGGAGEAQPFDTEPRIDRATLYFRPVDKLRFESSQTSRFNRSRFVSRALEALAYAALFLLSITLTITFTFQIVRRGAPTPTAISQLSTPGAACQNTAAGSPNAAETSECAMSMMITMTPMPSTDAATSTPQVLIVIATPTPTQTPMSGSVATPTPQVAAVIATPTQTPMPGSTMHTPTATPTQTPMPGSPTPTLTVTPTRTPMPGSPTPTPSVTPTATPLAACLSTTAQALDVVLVLDRSASMREVLALAQETAHGLIASLPPDTKLGLVSFTAKAGLDAPLGADARDVERAIDAAEAHGGTDLAAGIALAQSELEGAQHRSGASAVMIILSDGKDQPLVAATRAATTAKAGGIHIVAIGIGSHVESLRLRQLASSDSSYVAVRTDADLTTLEDLVSRLCGA